MPDHAVDGDRTDWLLLARAVQFYTARGFLYTEVPWFVHPVTADLIPRPPHLMTRRGDGEMLAASPELAFVERDLMSNAEHLTEGRFVACAPSFTDRDGQGGMQVVLYQTDAIDDAALANVAHAALDFHRYHFDTARVALEPAAGGGYALFIGERVVGSYQRRSHGMLNWIYGTGLIQPLSGARLAVSRPA